jgi:hypothetical protein
MNMGDSILWRILKAVATAVHSGDHQESHNPKVVVSELRLPPALTDQLVAEQNARAADSRRTGQIDRERLLVEKWMLGVGVVGTTLALITLWFVRSSTDAATAAASAAQEQNRLSDQNMRMQQRAWVGAVDATLTQPITAGQVPLIRFVIRNSGPTPALRSRNEQAAGLWHRDKPFAPSYAAKSLTGPSESVLFPGMAVPIFAQTDGPLTADLIGKMQREEWTLYAFGRLTYVDVFGAVHSSEFCTYLASNLRDLRWCSQFNIAN